MQLDYWIDKWNKGDTAFHRAEYLPALVKCFPTDETGGVVVPLCGKSRDMLWLAEQGREVVGIEASELAARAFFTENGIACREERRGDFLVLSGGRITIWCGDFFKMKKEDLPGGITAVYDRAALIALTEDLRARYAAHLTALLPGERVRYLLVAMEYPQEKVKGPPFSVDAAEVQRLFQGAFAVRELRRREDTVMPAINAKFQGVTVWETVYMLTKDGPSSGA